MLLDQFIKIGLEPILLNELENSILKCVEYPKIEKLGEMTDPVEIVPIFSQKEILLNNVDVAIGKKEHHTSSIFNKIMTEFISKVYDLSEHNETGVLITSTKNLDNIMKARNITIAIIKSYNIIKRNCPGNNGTNFIIGNRNTLTNILFDSIVGMVVNDIDDIKPIPNIKYLMSELIPNNELLVGVYGKSENAGIKFIVDKGFECSIPNEDSININYLITESGILPQNSYIKLLFEE